MDAKMYVGNLSYDVTQEELQALFEAHGAVSDVFIVKDRESGRPRGFAFRDYGNEKTAMDAAIEALNGAEFMGRNLAINEARPREERPRGGQGGGGYGGGGGRGGQRRRRLRRRRWSRWQRRRRLRRRRWSAVAMIVADAVATAAAAIAVVAVAGSHC